MNLELFVTEGLGDNSYLLASGSEAVVVDPQRDAWRYLEVIERRGLRLHAVLETHVHNDYVSGALELRAATGAEVAVPAKGGYAFPHRGLGEGDELAVGDLTVTAVETPGHTPEHLSYLVSPRGSEAPVATFTGGSLIVGSAGRTDLLGDDRAEDLARQQFRSLRRLAALPDEVQVLPTHGAGSFCATTRPSEARTSTLGEERAANPALAAADEEAFVRQQLSGLLAYPAYYRHMAPINRAGPKVLGGIPELRGLSPGEVQERLDRGGWVVDGRDRVSFATGHVTGALNIELDASFASYVGWVVPFGEPLVLVLADDRAAPEAATQLMRIGYQDVGGYLAEGMEAWAADGRAVSSYAAVDVDELCRARRAGEPVRVLDVRQRKEWEGTHIEDSLHIFVGDLPARLDEVPRDREVWAICGSGHRSAVAASILDRAGVPVRLVRDGGVREFLARCGDG